MACQKQLDIFLVFLVSSILLLTALTQVGII